MFLIPISVRADHIYSIDIDKFGIASMTEFWGVLATSGSEWYVSRNITTK